MRYSFVSLFVAGLVAVQLLIFLGVEARNKHHTSSECERSNNGTTSSFAVKKSQKMLGGKPANTTAAQLKKCAGFKVPEYNHTGQYDLPRIYV